MTNSPIFIYMWCSALAGCGVYLLYLEWVLVWKGESNTFANDSQSISNGILIPGSDYLYPLFYRFGWFSLGVWLILNAWAFRDIDRNVQDDLTWPACGLVVGLLRIVWGRFIILRLNKHKFLVGDNELALRGERGVITENTSSIQSCKVHLGNPAFGKDDLECVSDEQLNVGDRVEIIKTECGLVTVQKITHS